MTYVPHQAKLWSVAAIVFAVSLVAFSLLVQDVTFGDGVLYLDWVRQGRWYAHHHLYLPGMVPFVRLLEFFGVSDRSACFLYSAFMVAVGNALLYLVIARHERRTWHAVLLVLLASTAPVVLFFGTTVENHGQHYAWVCLALLLVDVAATKDRLWMWFAAGAGLATVPPSHLTGFMLVPAFALLAWTDGGRERVHLEWTRARILRMAVYLAPMAVYVTLFHLTTSFRTEVLGITPDLLADPIGFEFESKIFARGLQPSEWLPYLGNTWILPAFGTWAVFLLGFWRLWPARYRLFWIALIGIVPYVVMLPLHHFPERGAYYLALVPWVSFILSRLGHDPILMRLIAPWCVIAALVQGFVGVSQVRSFPDNAPPDDKRWAQAWANDAVRVNADQPNEKKVYLCADLWRATHLRYDHNAVAMSLPVFVMKSLELQAPNPRAKAFAWLSETLPKFMATSSVYVTNDTWEQLPTLLPELRTYLEQACKLSRVRAGRFEGWHVEPK